MIKKFDEFASDLNESWGTPSVAVTNKFRETLTLDWIDDKMMQFRTMKPRNDGIIVIDKNMMLEIRDFINAHVK